MKNQDTTTDIEPQPEIREVPPLPAMLLDEPGEEVPQPQPQPMGMFCFGALLMRIRDGGDIHTDVVSGWNTGFNQDHAQASFVVAVREQYPGYSITKVTGQALVSPQ